MRKKILLSILTLAFVAIAVGTTTFAWFTLSNQATINNITGEVQAGEGLEIGLSIPDGTPTNYKTNLTSTDWNDEVMSKLTNFTFGAVSTQNVNVFSHLVAGEPVGGVTPLNMEILSTKNVEKTYLEFEIHFKSDTAGKIMWTGFQFNDAGDGKNVENAARIAIISNNGTPVVVQQGAFNTNVQTNGVGIVAGQYQNLIDGNNAIYWDDSYGGTLAEVIDPTTQVTFAQAVTDLGTGIEVIDSLANETKVTVRVWLEGWDPDTYDNILRGNLNFNLSFEKVPLTP